MFQVSIIAAATDDVLHDTIEAQFRAGPDRYKDHLCDMVGARPDDYLLATTIVDTIDDAYALVVSDPVVDAGLTLMFQVVEGHADDPDAPTVVDWWAIESVVRSALADSGLVALLHDVANPNLN